MLAGVVAVGLHLLFALVLLSSLPRPRHWFEPDAITVNLVRPPPPPAAESPTPSPKPPGGGAPTAAPRPHPAATHALHPRPAPNPLPPIPAAAAAATAELTDSQLSGAITAGSGGGSGAGGGRACDMVRRLQEALRRDSSVQAAVAFAHHDAPGPRRALLVWNGDWVQSSGEDGKGLARVRQAIMVEVGFAPEACRTEPVHGLVLISLNDGPGGARLALGGGNWRWSDLLFAPGGR